MAEAVIIPRGKGWYDVAGTKVRGYQNAVRASQNGAHNSEAEAFTLQRLDFLRTAGIQYGGDRDVYKVAGYKKHPTLDDYWGYYDRHPIAAKIIDMPAQTTWRHAPEVVEPDVEDDTEFMAAFNGLVDRLGLWSRFERVDRLARLGQYAVLLIGARGQQDWEAPLGAMSGPDDVAYLVHYSQRAVHIERWVEDPTDGRFGLPELYRIDLSRKGSAFQPGTRNVHWTRVIHVAEDTLEDDIYGRPVLKRVLNTIFNDEKVDASAAEAFWQLADKILQLSIDPQAANVDMDAVEQDMRAIYHDLRRMAAFQGGELSWLSGEPSDPTGLSEILATKMAAGAYIPKRILFGSERGELASSQDERNYFGTVSERQQHHAEPNMLRALVDRLLDTGALPRPGEDGYEVLWPDLYVPSDEERATRNKLVAETAAALTPIGGDPYELVEVDDDRDLWLRPSEEVLPGRTLPVMEPPMDGGEDDEEEPMEEEAA